MEEYITKEQAIAAMEQVTRPECFIEDTRKNFVKIIEELPAADVVEVVRCNDCDYAEFDEPLDYGALYKCQFWDGEHYGEHPTVGGDDFCSYGVRRP